VGVIQENISPRLGVSPKVFESQIEYLRRKNYRSVAFEDLEKHILFGQSLPRIRESSLLTTVMPIFLLTLIPFLKDLDLPQRFFLLRDQYEKLFETCFE
jgi:hypothetical protein